MKLTKGVRYALRMLVDIARESDGTSRVNLNQVARNTMMPRRYLEQLAMPLRRASLLEGTTGRGGGYVLARSPEDIPVSDVIEAVQGPVCIANCALDPESCSIHESCECQLLYSLVNKKITELFQTISLADMGHESWPETAREGIGGP